MYLDSWCMHFQTATPILSMYSMMLNLPKNTITAGLLSMTKLPEMSLPTKHNKATYLVVFRFHFLLVINWLNISCLINKTIIYLIWSSCWTLFEQCSTSIVSIHPYWNPSNDHNVRQGKVNIEFLLGLKLQAIPTSFGRSINSQKLKYKRYCRV